MPATEKDALLGAVVTPVLGANGGVLLRLPFFGGRGGGVPFFTSAGGGAGACAGSGGSADP